ncbi:MULTISPECIES: chemotaxis protein CheW [unclassified Paenibacillus]|uniref:chemotaxis protein CheW n=1 Tax=unclassified Paenibacillus TaxID=185978 RepID=UPI001AE6493D|nr:MULTISPECIES: chemotaxis protein CheW [unclassified Paenibacillus]MBP1155716.1 purine-binding chemotaxis protein CheW [Paenibacillus sp. PvP091]MBP1168898.1 purine-binding chemotaxis protein CheW [Paenibacillus sp. PvR098]MBP2439926.1 purine-binding chemotaxis protein CheW [Paenibacillus sp. PvP052]
MSFINQQFAVFTINKSMYGLPIQEISEIIRMQTVNWTPNSQREVLGMIHLREKVIPIISLHRVFLETEKELDSKTRIIVIHAKGKEIGIVVDEVDKVMLLPEQYISPPPYRSENGWMRGVYHHEELIIALVHMEAVLGNVDMDLF